MPKLTPCLFWFEDRSKPETRARERAHLAAMERREREAIAFGFKCRPETDKPKREQK